MKRTLVPILTVFMILLFGNVVFAYSEELDMNIEKPVVFTSTGESAVGYAVHALLQMANVPYDLCLNVDESILQMGSGFPVRERDKYWQQFESSYNFPEGTPFKTVVFMMGALEEYGTDYMPVFFLKPQITANLEWAKNNRLTIIGMHITGKKDRGTSLQSENEEVIDLITPYCDMLIVTNSSNYDGKFTDIGEEFNIPVLKVEKITDLVPILQELFGFEMTE